MFEALCKGLLRNGHRIDMISHFPSAAPISNYTDVIDLTGTRDHVVNSFSIDHGTSLQKSMTYNIATEFGGDLCHLMGHETMQKFIENPPNDPPYDLVITEYLGAVCYLGFGHLLRVPVAIASSFLQVPCIHDFMGNNHNYAFFSGAYNEGATLVTFPDRLWNFLSNFMEMQLFYYYTSDQTKVMRKYLGQDVPDVRELERTVALALVNGHHSVNGVRPITPAIVDVGGLHVEFDHSELTRDLKIWLDSANDGVVYFTFGSLTNIETLPRDTLLDLYASFAKVTPVKVLMRCANASKLPPGLPSNVLIKPWFPQVPILGHKNTRVFITHGGLMGVQEALYYGVPLIGIPIFSDQMRNINIFVEKNVAIAINLNNLTKNSMDAALNAILNDPKYKEAAQKASRSFRDRPMSAMDTAIYWIEYVIRNGPESLRSPMIGIPWWKRNLIDVLGFIVSYLVLCVYVSRIFFKASIRKLYGSTHQAKKKLN
ncbi:UDP-glucuronosyltransferase 1-6 [Dufourea novaeangliae]|uniref:UDP-glucuronosyltransferase n=1 Tax=Dufourea novaeangliae TaxID=178035 RepID=A0A154PP45_DUFNO|nr:UDP-glucuronosyltransferase 1-6 [Dufourea novaeangliae]